MPSSIPTSSIRGGSAAPSWRTFSRFRTASAAAAVFLGLLALLLLVLGVLIRGPAHQPITLSNSTGMAGFLGIGLAGCFVAWRQPRNAIGWILLAVVLSAVLSAVGGAYAAWDYRYSHGALPFGGVAVFLQLGWAPAIALFPLPVLLFPDGRLPSPRWRWVFWAYLAVATLWFLGFVGVAASGVIGQHITVDPTGQLVVLDTPKGLAAVVNNAANGLLLPLLGFWLLWVVRLVASYRHEIGERRQQLKWFMAGAAISGICLMLSFGAPSVGESDNVSTFAQVLAVVSGLGTGAMGVGLGMGILKYRLYDVDRLISRTLSYATVTGLLIGVYVGLVTLATRVLPFSSPLGVAASTLVAVALFNPLRRRVQRLVDKRFNRARYDAEATIEAFAHRLRADVDLEVVSSEFVRAVQASVEPTHVSLWLRPTDSSR
jgi:hypothetical protein